MMATRIRGTSIQATLELNDGGWHVVWYTDDDGGSGYGDRPMVAYWYGTRDDCERMRVLHPDSLPEGERPTWEPLEAGSGVDPFDLACERRFD